MTTGSITKEQEKQYDIFGQDLLKRVRKEVPLDKDGIQRLFANWDKVMKDVVFSFVKNSAADNRFELLTSFKMTAPKRYDHDTQLATFVSYAEKEKFFCYNYSITDANFANATLRLIPGRTYLVKIFGIKQGETVNSEDCLKFLATQQAIFVGAQGLSLVRQLKKGKFPMSKWTLSFDKEDALWRDADGNPGVPVMGRDSDGDWYFDLTYLGDDSHDGFCLLCVNDLSA